MSTERLHTWKCVTSVKQNMNINKSILVKISIFFLKTYLHRQHLNILKGSLLWIIISFQCSTMTLLNFSHKEIVILGAENQTSAISLILHKLPYHMLSFIYILVVIYVKKC